MIVFLTLCYVGLLAILLKLGVIKLNLWWKLSPAVWMLLLFVVLFIPMQWGAPSGPTNMYEFVIEIIPNVSGEVTDVPVKPLVPIERGQVLFTIDPVPYEAEVARLQAQLEAAKQNVEQLGASAEAAAANVTKTEEQVDVIKSQQKAALDAVNAAKAALLETEANRDAADIQVTDRTEQLAIAQKRLTRLEELVANEAATQDQLDAAQTQITQLQGQLNGAIAGARGAAAAVTRSQADVEAAESNERTIELQLKQLVEADIPLVEAEEKKARLAAESMIGDVHTDVATVQAQLRRAEYDLDQTVVKAPAEGHVVGLTLRPGQRVTSFPVRSWMAFVVSERRRLVVGVNQSQLRHVKPGQPAEVVFKLYPGKTYSATVESIATINPEGQVQPSGILPTAPTYQKMTPTYGVVIELEEEQDALPRLYGGAAGTATIYTESAKAAHVIRRVMLRMESWMNYIIP